MNGPLHIITDWSARGGTEAMLARYLGRSKFRPQSVVALLRARPELWDLAPEDVRTMSLGVCGAFESVSSLWPLRRIIRDEAPGAIICWLYHAHFMGSLGAVLAGYKGPILWNIRGCLHDSSGAPLLSRGTRAVIALSKFLRLRPDLALSNSERALKQHVEAGYVPPGGVVVPNGIALPQFVPARGRRLVVGMAGRFHLDKDYANFFAAAAEVARQRPETRFVAAGRGVTYTNAAAAVLVEAAGLPPESVSLIDEQPDLTGFYQSIGLFVLASRTEAFPNVLLEAMSAGVPCVSTDVGDAAAIIGNTGTVVPPKNPKALAAAMLSMLSLPEEEYRQTCEAARRRVEERFNLDLITARYDELVKSLIAKGNQRHVRGADRICR